MFESPVTKCPAPLHPSLRICVILPESKYLAQCQKTGKTGEEATCRPRVPLQGTGPDLTSIVVGILSRPTE